MLYAKERGRDNPYHEKCGGPLIIDRMGAERRTLEALVTASGVRAIYAYHRLYIGGCLKCQKEGTYEVRKPYKIASQKKTW